MHQSPHLLQCLSVYKEVRRKKKQIAAEHVSLEANIILTATYPFCFIASSEFDV